MSATKFDKVTYEDRRKELIAGIIAELQSRGFSATYDKTKYAYSSFTLARGAQSHSVSCYVSQHLTGIRYARTNSEFPQIEVKSSPSVTYKPDPDKGKLPNIKKICDRIVATFEQEVVRANRRSAHDERLRDALSEANAINNRLGQSVIGVWEGDATIKLDLNSIPSEQLEPFARLLIDNGFAELLQDQSDDLDCLRRRMDQSTGDSP